jgi:hypothetical protein
MVESFERRQHFSAANIIEVLHPSTLNYVHNADSSTPVAVTVDKAVNVRLNTSEIANFNPLTDEITWSFNDATSEYNNLPGFNAAHVYTNGSTGLKTISVTIRQPGQTTPITDTIDVQVSSNSLSVKDFSLAHSNTDVTTELRSALASNKMIRFERGGIYKINGEIDIAGRNNISFGAFGSGALPVLRQTTADIALFKVTSSSTNSTFSDLRFDSVFTSLSDSDLTSRPKLFNFGLVNGERAIGKNVLVQRCEFDHLDSIIEQDFESKEMGWLFLDNSTVDAASIRRYMIYLTGVSDLTMLGNYVHNSIGESDIRTPGVTRALYHDNQLYNPTVNWGSASGYEPTGDHIEPGGKSALRMMDGAYQYASKNYLSSPENWLGPLGGGDGFINAEFQNASARYHIFENNYVNGGVLKLNHGLKDSVVRNNIFNTNSPAIRLDQVTTDQDYPFNSSDPYAGAYRAVHNVKIVHNTRIATSTTGAGAFLEISNPGPSWDGNVRASALTVANNLQVGPNALAIQLGVGSESVFSYVGDNVWPSSGSTQPFRISGVAKTLSQWNATVTDSTNPDIATSSANVTSFVDSSTYRPTGAQADVGNVLSNARYDYYGATRSGSSVTAGAANRTTSAAVGSISGVYYGDDNGNGVQDGAETGQGSKTMYLDFDLDGTLDSNEPNVLTASNGTFTFSGITAGTYRVRRANLPSGYRFSTHPTGYEDVAVASGANVTGLTFGTTVLSTITGRYFGDSNENGAIDAGESGQFNKHMYIDANLNGLFDTSETSSYTDAAGYYRFDGLTSGTYRIRRNGLPTGFYLTTPANGYASISVGTAQLIENINFGTHEI